MVKCFKFFEYEGIGIAFFMHKTFILFRGVTFRILFGKIDILVEHLCLCLRLLDLLGIQGLKVFPINFQSDKLLYLAEEDTNLHYFFIT